MLSLYSVVGLNYVRELERWSRNVLFSPIWWRMFGLESLQESTTLRVLHHQAPTCSSSIPIPQCPCLTLNIRTPKAQSLLSLSWVPLLKLSSQSGFHLDIPKDSTQASQPPQFFLLIPWPPHWNGICATPQDSHNTFAYSHHCNSTSFANCKLFRL